VAWLVRGGDVLCSLEVASAPAERVRGLLGRDGVDGALLLTHCRSVHTLGMRFPIDVAFLNRQGRVVAVVAPMRRWRLGRTRLRASQVLEAEAGAFERWRLAVGDVLEVSGSDATAEAG
jgi:uncharacterized membrane protein (UPF0127 family)